MNRSMIAPLLFGLVGAGVLIWLGLWQVQRLAWKEGVLAEIATRMTAAPVIELPANPDPERDRYLSVKLDGVIGQGEIHVLVSRKQIGAGYRIVVPFETGGRRVLLDRGFVPVDQAGAARTVTDLSVTGNLHWPDDRTSATPDNDVAGNIWFARDLGPMAQVLDTEPFLIVARSGTGDAIDPLAVDASNIPNDHLQYAITWFLLAVVWLGMTGYMLWRIKRRITD